MPFIPPFGSPPGGGGGGGQTLYGAIVDAAGNGDYTLLSAALSAGETSIFIRNGTYVETADIDTSPAEINIRGENMRKTIIDFDSNRQLDVNSGDNDFIISNLTITGGDGNGALRIGSSRAKVDHCRFHSNNKDISIIGNDSVITNCLFESSTGLVIESGAARNIIDHCRLEGAAMTVASTANDNIISNSIFSINGTAISNAGVRNIITGNVFGSDDQTNRGSISITSDENIITGNVFVRGAANIDAITVSGSRNIIKGNIIQGQSIDYRDGILINTGDNNIVIGNQCIANDQYGINISGIGAVENLVMGNHLTDNVTAPINDAGLGTNIINNYPTDIIQDEKRFIQMKNTSGGQLVQGDLITLKAVAAGNEFTTTTIQGDDLVFGMVDETIASTATGRVQITGKTTALKVDGNTDISIGDFIGTFTSAGIGQKAAAGDMAIAIALEAYATNDSAGVIDALLISPRKI